MCTNLENFQECIKLTNSDLLPDSIGFKGGILDKNRQNNQMFFDFSTIYVKACDGYAFQGVINEGI